MIHPSGIENHDPVNLTPTDFTETRISGYHARWPCDPDTVRRLDAVRNSDPFAELRPRYKPNPLVVLLIVIGCLTGIVWIVATNL